MDSLEKYRQLIEQILQTYADLENSYDSGHEDDEHTSYLLFDHERDHYMLFRSGWQRYKPIRSAGIFIRLHNNKIYIEEDMTEDGVATELLEAGVPKEHIVLAFHHPTVREMGEFPVS